MDLSQLKRAAGRQAAEQIADGMAVGLGTGSTAYFAIERLAERIRDEKLRVTAVSTSFSTTLLCRQWGIPLVDAGAVERLDLAIDGADEIDPARNLIKGRGAAHTIEKIVAQLAQKFIVVADSTKEVQVLGTSMPVPVEVLPLALGNARRALLALGAQKVEIRMAGASKDGPVISDSGNLILDAHFRDIADPDQLEGAINRIAGVVENGLFSGCCHQVILATPEGLRTF